MKLPPRKKGRWNYPALAFALPFCGMLLVMLVSQYAPFGKYSILYSDMYHQYYPFFVAFRKALLSGDSLLYSWDVGMGMDYLGLISYYLASPLNLLSVLLPEGWLLAFFSLMVPVRIGLAGLFFAIFLKKTFHRDDLSITLFGSFYALCAWAMGYLWNVMWLDTFALLPLVALGALSLLRERRFFLYTVTLFLSVASNYYIGFFTCIFVFLLFWCYQICRFRSFKQLFADLGRIALFSALAIGMTAFLELPALAALQSTQSSVNSFPSHFSLNIAKENTWLGLLDAMRQVAGNMGGGLEPTFKEGLPNIYTGVGTLMLAILFLCSGKVKIRDKICSVFLLLFFMLSFIVRQLDYIWHGFHFTNMIPYRFSFLFSFVMLYMAYRAYLLRKSFRSWQIILSAVVAAALLACSDSRTDYVFVSYNLLFILLYLSVFLYSQHGKRPSRDLEPEVRKEQLLKIINRRTQASMLLAGIMVLELTLNLVNWGISFGGTDISNYPKGTTYTASMVRYMKEREKNTLFYRAETTRSQTLNDGALNGYHGISAFTSSANVKVTEFMKALGYGAKNTYNRYCFEESSPVANLFLNLKYMLERDGKVEENQYFSEIHHYGNVYLLKNNAYLPLGFLTDTQLSTVDFDKSHEAFEFQNTLLSSASGITGKVWNIVSPSALSLTVKDAEIESQNSFGYCSYSTMENEGELTYSFRAESEGLMCIHIDQTARNSFTVFLNGKELYREGYSLPQMISVSKVVPGDVVDVKLKCNANTSGSATVTAAITDDAYFEKAYTALNRSTLELTEFKNTFISGTIDCHMDGLLYTSIPQDGNWQAAVDGKPVTPILVGDAMIALPITQGHHTVTFHYHNAAFSLGWKISLVCLILFLILVYPAYRPKRSHGKFEK